MIGLGDGWLNCLTLADMAIRMRCSMRPCSRRESVSSTRLSSGHSSVTVSRFFCSAQSRAGHHCAAAETPMDDISFGLLENLEKSSIWSTGVALA